MDIKKLSLQQLALNITKKNIEKTKGRNVVIKTKNVNYKKKKSNIVNVIKNDDGTLTTFIPVKMHNNGLHRCINTNIEKIKEFKNNDSKILKL